MKLKRAAINKITPPDLPDVILREQLFDRLDQKQHSRITWISGVAGSGKTTLAASYIRTRDLPCLWYRIDEGDNDLSTFFYYLGLGAKKVFPDKHEPLPLFTPEFFMGAAVFACRFFENLGSCLTLPFVMVFDDYQNIARSSDFHEVLKSGLTMLPDGVQVIVSSRTDPPAAFSALIANKQMRVVTSKDLRMCFEETRQLLQMDTGSSLSGKFVRQIHETVNGWAAGLVLMSKSIQRDPAVARHAATIIPFELFDYFAGELFDKLDAVTRNFLIKTSFLPQFTPEMAQKLTGRTDAVRLLDNLQRQNIFIERIAGAAFTYQYHALFRKFLKDRAGTDLDPDSIAVLKRKGAALLEASGQVEDAVALFDAAGDTNNLVRIVKKNAAHLILHGRSKTLVQWVERLSEEIREKTPWMDYWLAMGNLATSPDIARMIFEKSFYRFIRCGDTNGTYLAWAGVIDAIATSWNDFTLFDPWIDWLEKSLKDHPGLPAGEVETKVTVCMMAALLIRQPEHPDLEQWIRRGLALSRKSSDMQLHLQAVNWAMTYYAWIGEFGKAEALRDVSRTMTRSYQAAPGMAIYWKWLDVSTRLSTMTNIDTILDEIAEVLELIHHTGLYAWEHIFLMPGIFASLLQGRFQNADRFLKRLEAILDSTHFHGYAIFHHFAGLYHLLDQNSPRALAHAETAAQLSNDSGYVLVTIVCQIQLAFIRHDQGQAEAALETLSSALNQAREIKSHIYAFMCLMVSAKIILDEDEQKGLECLRKALALGRQHGYLNMIWWWHPQMVSQLCEKALLAGIETEYVRRLIRVHKLVPASKAGRIETWPWAIKIYSFSRFQVRVGGEPLAFKGRPPKKPLELLQAIIAFGGIDVPIDRILDALWYEADGDMAHSAFSTALNRLRKLLHDKEAIVMSNGRITLNPECCWVDCLAFEHTLTEGDALWKRREKEAALGCCQQALAMYKGLFLASEHPLPWIIATRERFKNRFLAATLKMGQWLEGERRFDAAMVCYQKGLSVDNLEEALYQRLMNLQLRLEHPSEAVRTYQRCQERLAAVLKVAPSRATEALYRKAVLP